MLDQDADEMCRVKALYAISCLCRDCLPAMTRLNQLDGWSVVLRAIQTDNVPRLRTKGCFFLAAVVTSSAALSTKNATSGGGGSGGHVERLVSMGMVQQLAAIVQQPLDITHEHVLNFLLALVSKSEATRADAQQPKLELANTLTLKLGEASDQDEYLETVQHIKHILKICFKDEIEDVANR